jgi:AcrR family transcriptional regulator
MTTKRMGRPREFDEETVLDAAMKLFWERGYEGTSMADLAKVMGLSPSSIYVAFGDKEALFQRAADKYARDARAGGSDGSYRAAWLRYQPECSVGEAKSYAALHTCVYYGW